MTESDRIQRSTIGREQANGFAGFIQFEIRVQVRAIGAVLIGFIVGPNQQKALGRHDIAACGGYLELEFVGESVSQVIAAEIHRIRAGIVEFEPILEIAIGRVGEGDGVVGHPFIDKDGRGSVAGVVGRAGCDVEKAQAVKNLRIGKRTVGAVGTQAGIINVIKDLRLAIVKAAQGERTRAARECEAGVQLSQS